MLRHASKHAQRPHTHEPGTGLSVDRDCVAGGARAWARRRAGEPQNDRIKVPCPGRRGERKPTAAVPLDLVKVAAPTPKPQTPATWSRSTARTASGGRFQADRGPFDPEGGMRVSGNGQGRSPVIRPPWTVERPCGPDAREARAGLESDLANADPPEISERPCETEKKPRFFISPRQRMTHPTCPNIRTRRRDMRQTVRTFPTHRQILSV